MLTKTHAPVLYFFMSAALVVALMMPLVTAAATMCTEEAMQCPDGSWVGRTGPNCEFVCGGVTQNPSTPGSMPGGAYQGSIPPSASAPATPPSGTYTNYPGTEHPGTEYPGSNGTYTNYPDTEYPGASGSSGICAQDAMQCADGSYVGRTGPSCTFVCPGSTTPAPIAPPVGFWNGFFDYWFPPSGVSGGEPVPSGIAPPVGTFEGDPSMTDDMTPVFSVTSGAETVLPPDDGFLWGVGDWVHRLFFWFW